MKRLLMITSAVGLCLAAPAFAQSTNPDQINQPQATSPNATSQQPANQDRRQNQRGQTQNEQQSAPSSRAQAPASSNQSGSASDSQNQNQSGQAQNRRQPSDNTSAQAPAGERQQRSATDRSRPQGGQAQNREMRQENRRNAQSDRMQNRQSQRDNAQNARAQSRDRDGNRAAASSNVNINETQRTRIASAINSTNVRPINVNFRIATGVAVPRSVALHTLPSDIVEIVPQYRGYSYFVTRNQIVIVEPRRKSIVAVLPAGGAAARAQAPSTRTTFTDQQREVIRGHASALRSVETTGASSQIVVEQEVPATVELQEFPAEIVTEVPTIRTYRYFRQNNDIVVVDPGPRRVIEVIR